MLRCCHCIGLLAKLCDILMASGVPADVLTETINTVSEVIRGNQYNQEYFASVMAPSTPPRYCRRIVVSFCVLADIILTFTYLGLTCAKTLLVHFVWC